jgi:hypothetical protein
MLASTNPMGIARLVNKTILDAMAAEEPERFDRLEAAGFKLIRYGDIIAQLFERFGGHYMDVGASAKIADGLVSPMLSRVSATLTDSEQIKMKSDALISRYDKDGLIFEDGTKVEADVIVFATGFVANMRNSVRDFFGEEVASRVEDFWGLDSEGEIKGAFRPSGRKCLPTSPSLPCGEL